MRSYRNHNRNHNKQLTWVLWPNLGLHDMTKKCMLRTKNGNFVLSKLDPPDKGHKGIIQWTNNQTQTSQTKIQWGNQQWIHNKEWTSQECFEKIFFKNFTWNLQFLTRKWHFWSEIDHFYIEIGNFWLGNDHRKWIWMKVQILNPHIPKNRSVWIISNVCNSYFLENIFSLIFIIQIYLFFYQWESGIVIIK